jgi:hypothetical protein
MRNAEYARWALALAMLGILWSPLRLGAQRRAPVAPHTGRPVTTRPGPRSPLPLIHPPFRTSGLVPPFAGRRGHKPIPFRSPIFGLVLVDARWCLAPDVGDESMVPPATMTPPGPPLTGGVQLDIEPRRALVYVDGLLAGTVDQFSGYYRHLETSAGLHVIDLVTPDYVPMTISVTVVPNQTTTYRATLNRASRH